MASYTPDYGHGCPVGQQLIADAIARAKAQSTDQVAKALPRLDTASPEVRARQVANARRNAHAITRGNRKVRIRRFIKNATPWTIWGATLVAVFTMGAFIARAVIAASRAGCGL